jgi:predicted dehydrogenase
MQELNRRQFVKSTLTAATAVALSEPSRVLGANDHLIAAVVGAGGRGTFLAQKFAARKDVTVAYVCDPDLRRANRAAEAVARSQSSKPKALHDFRPVLGDRSVDLLINATPDHWHALATIWACQAGKDVFVEKPLSHNLWEGRKMIEAARKYSRVVQVGMQSRSAEYVHTARQYIQSGKMGSIHMVRVHNQMQHPFVKLAPEQAPPDEFDYDLWCGPAAKLPYVPNRPWLNFAEFSCGPIPGDLVHQIDLVRFLMGDPAGPRAISHSGGLLALRDGRDTPDTQLATYEFENWLLLAQSTLWTPYMHKIPQPIRNSDAFPEWPFCATKVEVLGEDQFMYFGRHGGGWQVLDGKHQVVEQAYGRQADDEHIDDFISCVRSRGRPAADVEQGHYSAMLCHLANIAWQTGNQKLSFDPQTETFPEASEANAFLKRPNYRAPFVVPDAV